MTRYSVERFRIAVLRMYLRLAVIISIPLFLFYHFYLVTPDRGWVLLCFAAFSLWLKMRIQQQSEASLHYAGWCVLAMLAVMLYGIFVSQGAVHNEAWMMLFPVVFMPIVAARERIVWTAVGLAGFAAVALLRPEPISAASLFVLAVAYLTLAFFTMTLVRHNEQNIERLAHLSIIDPLTQTYNRGFMRDVLASEVNRCRRCGQPLTIIMLDIDHFKAFNDSHGHLFGDSVLEQVADVLRRTAQRAGDRVFRYGGEEFCVVAPGLGRKEAALFAEKLRQGIWALEIENGVSPHGRLSISIGFWCAPDLSELTPSALLLNADNALYRAKAAGRNAVVDFEDIQPAAGGQGLARSVAV